ncbi:MAG: C_GCAxxG_C_C family protein, partial [Bacteroidales bacterium]|nr:C_GCAxxG_C_C family protein [Bacteroidales bacterium]
PHDMVQVQQNRALVKAMAERFRGEYGDIVCRNLLQNKEKHSCADFVAFAARIVGEAVAEQE